MEENFIPDENECRCQMKRLLSTEEKNDLVYLMKRLGRRSPSGEKIILLDSHDMRLMNFSCKHLYSFGFDCYCDNQAKVDEFIKS